MYSTVLFILTFVLVVTHVTSLEYISSGDLTFPTDIASETLNVKLDSGSISDIPLSIIEPLTQLQKLTVINHALTTFPDLTPVGDTLTFLDLSQNDIVYIDPAYFDALKVIEIVFLYKNYNLGTIPNVDGPANTLIELKLWNTPYVTTPLLSKYKNLQVLSYARAQNVEEAVCTGLESLVNLYLKGSKIPALPEVADAYQTLNVLELKECQRLVDAPELRAAKLRNITKLDLIDSALTTLPTLCLWEPGNVEIKAIDSSLDPCSCEMIWLKMVEEAGGIVSDMSASCAGTPWLDLTAEDMMYMCPQVSPSNGRC